MSYLKIYDNFYIKRRKKKKKIPKKKNLRKNSFSVRGMGMDFK